MILVCCVENLRVESLNHESDLTIFISSGGLNPSTEIHVSADDLLRIEDPDDPQQDFYHSPAGQSGRVRCGQIRAWQNQVLLNKQKPSTDGCLNSLNCLQAAERMVSVLREVRNHLPDAHVAGSWDAASAQLIDDVLDDVLMAHRRMS